MSIDQPVLYASVYLPVERCFALRNERNENLDFFEKNVLEKIVVSGSLSVRLSVCLFIVTCTTPFLSNHLNDFDDFFLLDR